jgi:hypothetical protein
MVALAPWPELSAHPVIGIIDNTKKYALQVLTYLVEELAKEHVPGVDVVCLTKLHSGQPISEDDAAMLASRVDLVIAGVGDCGACASCSLRDAIMMESRGIPSTVIITEPFQGIVATHAVKLGIPGYHSVVLPHPIWKTDDNGLRKLVRQNVEVAWSQLANAGRAGIALVES